MKMLLSALAVLGFLLPFSAQAHPHAWIDVEITALANDKGQITGLRQVWYFDDAYSAFTLEGLRQLNGSDIPKAALLELAAENLTNLADYSWFTDFKADGDRQDFLLPEQFDQHHEDGRLIMSFDLMLETPVTANGASWQVYDPVYYIELLYKESDAKLVLAESLAQHLSCTARIEEPNPTEEMVIQAASLAIDEVAEDGLGALFAQKAIVTCP